MSELDVPAEEGEYTFGRYEVTVEKESLVQKAIEESGLMDSANTFEEKEATSKPIVTVSYSGSMTKGEINDLRESDTWDLYKVPQYTEDGSCIEIIFSDDDG